MTATILLVEDEPTLRTGTEQFLTQRGFTVIVAASGEEALEKFAEADAIAARDERDRGAASNSPSERRAGTHANSTT